MNNERNVTGQELTPEPVNLHEAETVKIPVIQEFVHVDKRVEEAGKVIITKQVIEEPAQLELESTFTEVMVEKRPVNQFVEENYPSVREEEGATVYAVFKEVLVKRLMLVEEIVVKHQTTRHTDVETVNLKREQVKIERNGAPEQL